MERAFSCGENLENEATVYLFFSFAPCGSKERESGYRLEIFIDENPIDEFLPLSLQRDILSIDIDNLMREFQPCIKHDRYKVSHASPHS